VGKGGDRLQRLAHLAEITAALAAVAAVLLSAWFFWQGAQEQKYAAALSILEDQMQLEIEHPELAYREPDATFNPDDSAYVEFASHALFTAETLFSLVGNNGSWRRTAAGIVDDHIPYVLAPTFPCDQYDPAFVDFVRTETRAYADAKGVSVCPPARDADAGSPS
jgi:hypothetical protein